MDLIATSQKQYMDEHLHLRTAPKLNLWQKLEGAASILRT